MTHPTPDQLRALGAASAIAGEDIYDAEIRSGMNSDELLFFEQGFFAQVERQGVKDVDPS